MKHSGGPKKNWEGCLVKIMARRWVRLEDSVTGNPWPGGCDGRFGCTPLSKGKSKTGVEGR